jgi:hypothetical protein
MEIVSSFSEVKKHLLLKKVSYDWILFVDIEKKNQNYFYVCQEIWNLGIAENSSIPILAAQQQQHHYSAAIFYVWLKKFGQ